MMASQCLYPDSKSLETFNEDFAVISGERGGYYTGRWLTGDLCGLKFPKETTRAMDDGERARFEQMNLNLSEREGV